MKLPKTPTTNTPHLHADVSIHMTPLNQTVVTSEVDGITTEVTINTLIKWLTEMRTIANGDIRIKLASGGIRNLTGVVFNEEYVVLDGYAT